MHVCGARWCVYMYVYVVHVRDGGLVGRSHELLT